MEINMYNKIKQQESIDYPLHAIKFLDPHVKSLDCEIDGLLDFEVQTTLESFIEIKKS
jgi:hypothetical protein